MENCLITQKVGLLCYNTNNNNELCTLLYSIFQRENFYHFSSWKELREEENLNIIFIYAENLYNLELNNSTLHSRIKTRIIWILNDKSENNIIELCKFGIHRILFIQDFKDWSSELLRMLQDTKTISPKIIFSLFHYFHKHELSFLNHSHLTQRENQLIQLISEGIKNQAIAEILRISPLTVKKQIHNIHKKLQVRNRIALLQKAKELGII
ncbi:MAG: response regulator transcription factor [Leptospiraceae bacterium]|nr:response regulator transcription factor [Leptospiraceae bacterium]MCP5499905.1 response regulator transcription factor [Leptospiraceae bacterium]